VAQNLRVLILGDIVGQPGCRALFLGLPELARRHSADLVIANGENAADGFGLTPEIANRMLASGVHVITSGNHIWQKREILPFLATSDTTLRPENYPVLSGPDAIPGKGHCLVTVRDVQVLVINLEGRVNLSPLRDPMTVGRSLLKQYKNKVRASIIDFHAESVDEKEALALFLDGEVSAVVGTHTHVQTADERILPRGTAYITDIGMTGPMDSVIGMKKETAIARSLSQMPLKMEVQNSAAEIQGVLVTIDPATSRAVTIERIRAQAAV
jgi:2',3'-cyclic-nucleotide 2'-phosphodiesterase